MLTPVVGALGGIAFLVSAFFILQDRRKAEETIDGTFSIIDDFIHPSGLEMNINDEFRLDEDHKL
jgi:hypothetical protein